MKYKLFLLLAFFVVPLSALAAEYHSGDNVLLASDQQIDSNHYAAGQNIEVYGTVNGDLFLAGDNITVDSENINGDIFAAGNTITIKGTVNGSVRTAGQQVNIMAQVRDNVMFFGQKLDLDTDSTIGGHVNFYGQRANMRGTVGGQFEGFVESALLSGTFNKDVELNLSKGKNLEVVDSAVINGTLYYKAMEEGMIAEGATITKGVNFDQIFSKSKTPWQKFSWKGLLFKFFGTLVVGMVLLYLFSKFFKDGYNWVRSHPWKSLWQGLVLLVITPIACLLLAITFIGLPLAFVAMSLWVIILYLAKVISAWLIGKFIKEKLFDEKKFSDITVLALGILIYIIISKIPYLGPLVVVIIYLMAWGAFSKMFCGLKCKK